MTSETDLLRANELIYGRLLPVEEPHLIDRYNKALAAFGLPATKLARFTIDRTGYSPEIADELGEPSYLDPNDVNRRFIILTPAQIELPVVHTAFSNTSQLVYEFMTKNQRAIDALTIKDVIYGEIEEFGRQGRDHRGPAVDQSGRVPGAVGRGCGRQGGRARHAGRPAEAGARRLAGHRHAQPHGRTRQSDRRHPRERAGARSGDLPPQRLSGRAISAASMCSSIPMSTTVISDPTAPGFRRSRPWQVSYLPIRDADQVFRFLAGSGRMRTAAGLLDRDVGLSRAPRRDGAEAAGPSGRARP